MDQAIKHRRHEKKSANEVREASGSCSICLGFAFEKVDGLFRMGVGSAFKKKGGLQLPSAPFFMRVRAFGVCGMVHANLSNSARV